MFGVEFAVLGAARALLEAQAAAKNLADARARAAAASEQPDVIDIPPEDVRVVEDVPLIECKKFVGVDFGGDDTAVVTLAQVDDGKVTVIDALPVPRD